MCWLCDRQHGDMGADSGCHYSLVGAAALDDDAGPPEPVEFESGVLRCRYCDAVYSFMRGCGVSPYPPSPSPRRYRGSLLRLRLALRCCVSGRWSRRRGPGRRRARGWG